MKDVSWNCPQPENWEPNKKGKKKKKIDKNLLLFVIYAGCWKQKQGSVWPTPASSSPTSSNDGDDDYNDHDDNDDGDDGDDDDDDDVDDNDDDNDDDDDDFNVLPFFLENRIDLQPFL